MKKFLFFCLIIVLLIIAYSQLQTSNNDFTVATVVRVVDGDTIVLNDGRTVRYIGIDTPEKDSKYTKYECYSKNASDENNNLVLNKTVKLVADVEPKDKYDRFLYYVYLEDGTFINEQLVKGGFAESKAYPPNLKYQSILDKAEANAKKQNLGLWNCVQ